MDYDYSDLKRQICVLVGAGMSAGAGIPTFRADGGSWQTDRLVRDAFDIKNYLDSASARKVLWRWLAESPAWSATPTRAHWLLKQLDDAGHLVSVMTQNFDMLEKRAGIRQGKIRQLHGRLTRSLCLKCRQYFDTRQICDDLSTRPDPHCSDCGGLIKPDIVFFGEELDEMTLKVVYGLDIPACDELWCIGSSLLVYPAASLPIHAKKFAKRVVIVSTDRTALDGLADEIIRQPADIAVAALVSRTLD